MFSPIIQSLFRTMSRYLQFVILEAQFHKKKKWQDKPLAKEKVEDILQKKQQKFFLISLIFFLYFALITIYFVEVTEPPWSYGLFGLASNPSELSNWYQLFKVSLSIHSQPSFCTLYFLHYLCYVFIPSIFMLNIHEQLWIISFTSQKIKPGMKTCWFALPRWLYNCISIKNCNGRIKRSLLVMKNYSYKRFICILRTKLIHLKNPFFVWDWILISLNMVVVRMRRVRNPKLFFKHPN